MQRALKPMPMVAEQTMPGAMANHETECSLTQVAVEPDESKDTSAYRDGCSAVPSDQHAGQDAGCARPHERQVGTEANMPTSLLLSEAN